MTPLLNITKQFLEMLAIKNIIRVNNTLNRLAKDFVSIFYDQKFSNHLTRKVSNKANE